MKSLLLLALTPPLSDKDSRVLVWDEQPPGQKTAYGKKARTR